MQLTRYDYTVSVEAECEEDADKIIAARIDHDEDLSEDGIGEYNVYCNPVDPTTPRPEPRFSAYGSAR